MIKSIHLDSSKIIFNDKFIDQVVDYLKSSNSPKLGSLNLYDYINGIQQNKYDENGLYIFYFPDNSYYIGRAGSCTLLERLAKHIDSRKSGSFNSVLKGIGIDIEPKSYFTENQKFFLEATFFFISVRNFDSELIPEMKSQTNPLNWLEVQVIRIMKNKGLDLKNKRIPKI